jgi:diguanylate cyclase (GGDEF)-like protein
MLMASVLAVLAALALLVLRLRRHGGALALDEARAERLGSHHHLSGLFNQHTFHERLAEKLEGAKRTHAGFALHLIDLDRFKDLNGSLGHQAGDVVTSAMGKRIANTARAMAVVARLGGNELAIIQMNADSIHKASALIHRMHEVLATRSSLTLSGSAWAIRSASSLGRSWMSTARA